MPTHEDQSCLLDLMSRMGSQGRAEGEDAAGLRRTFLPVPEHMRAFDPDVVLVVGPRGAGKTELFRTVIEQGLLPLLSARIPGVRLPPLGSTAWLSGYSSRGTDFPSEPQFREFLLQRPATDELFLDLWLAYLLRVLKDQIQDPSLGRIFAPQGGDLEGVLAAYRGNTKTALLALDALDGRLDREDRFVFVGYDELDTLARNDPDLTRVAVRGLVALWAGHSRRWKRVRGKIFLRSDRYERAATAGGADFAKLAANRAEIAWSDRHLLAMLVRRLANSGDDLRRYAEKSRIGLEDGGDLGLFPLIARADDARPLIERMVGPYMGAGHKKGEAFRWVLDHIRDGRRQALPRPLVRLFEAAAELQKASATWPRLPRLLEPRALRRPLATLSGAHVARLDSGRGSRTEEAFETLRGSLGSAAIDRHLDHGFGDSGDKGCSPSRNVRTRARRLSRRGRYLPRARRCRVDAPDLFQASPQAQRWGAAEMNDRTLHPVVSRLLQSRFLTIPRRRSAAMRERFFELLAGRTLGDVAEVIEGSTQAT